MVFRRFPDAHKLTHGLTRGWTHENTEYRIPHTPCYRWSRHKTDTLRNTRIKFCSIKQPKFTKKNATLQQYRCINGPRHFILNFSNALSWPWMTLRCHQQITHSHEHCTWSNCTIPCILIIRQQTRKHRVVNNWGIISESIVVNNMLVSYTVVLIKV